MTLTERNSNYLLMGRASDKSTDAVGKVAVRCLKASQLPVLTITLDNSTEFANYGSIAKAVKADFYFAHPYHAWERDADEHNNKLIRQYLPKQMTFSQVDEQQVVSHQERINDHPRKKLNYFTLNEHMKFIRSTPFVALRT